MKNLKILDCTLRDGGFINDWEFGKNTIINICERLDYAGINIIELGYLRDYVDYSEDNTQFSCVKDIFNVIKKKPDNAEMLVVIIDYGSCSLERICPASESVIDGIRVTFKKDQLDEAGDFCKKIAEKGYKVFMQPVSIMDYSDADVIRLVNKANEINPYALYIVDTYGFMHKRDLLRYWILMNTMLVKDICIGYHAHNNFQLAYANAIELMEINTTRTVIIDSSAFGMGKGAGNANTELIALYLNENFGYGYDISHVLEIIDTYIEREREKNFWGYSLLYYLAASNDCHHNYVRYLINKKTLSVKSINEILSSIDIEKKTKYDKNYAEELYQEYQGRNKSSFDDLEKLKSSFLENRILLLGPGNSVLSCRDDIIEYAKKDNFIIVSINHISDVCDADFVFISNVKRYEQINAVVGREQQKSSKFIITSNIATAQLKPDYVVDYTSLVSENDALNYDNSMLMFIELLRQMGVKEVSLAGFDGYTNCSSNYFKPDMEFNSSVTQEIFDLKNMAVSRNIAELNEVMKITFITKSKYEN